MDNIKDKYQMRFVLFLACFIFSFVLSFYAIWYEYNIFLILFLVLVCVMSCYFTYESLMNRLALRKKFEVVYESSINLKDYFNKKIEKKNKIKKIIDKLFFISIYASPILIIFFISLGIFLLDSLALSIVAPAFIISYLVILFFIKDIYGNIEYTDKLKLMEVVIINKKCIVYKGKVYIFNYTGFHIRGKFYKFLFIPLSKIEFDESLETIIEEVRSDEISD